MRDDVPVTLWVDGARADRGGLFIPGGPGGHGADLLLSPADVHLMAKGVQVSLVWEGHSRQTSTSSASHWSIGGWGAGNVGYTGVGVDGPASLEPIRRVTGTLRNRALAWNPYNRFIRDSPTVPLWALSRTSTLIDNQRHTMVSLCTLLAERPPLRPLLADTQRVTRLAADLSQHFLGLAATAVVKPTTAGVVAALHAAGYQHSLFDRPLPADRFDDRPDIIARVMQRLAASPYGTLDVSAERVGELVDRYYLTVQPWPFAALDV
ncbi:MAG: hypothetical protein QOJ62_1018 [Actinomycetota bacterium]|nr:hypothetical protein [Actinomycetota bacterium]